MKFTKDIQQERLRWEREKEIDRAPAVKSELGVPVKVVYDPEDVADQEFFQKIGYPGEYPFTRGVYPTMYRVRPWAMRLYAGFGTAEDTNRRWKFLLKTGNQGVACAFDLPTQMGIDSNHELAEEEVGRVGLAVDTLRDMEILYEGLPLDTIVSSFNINAPAAILLAMYVALGEKQGVQARQLSGTLSNDILCEYVSRGMWVFGPKPALRLTTDIVEYCTKNLPKFYPFNVRGIIMREAGASMTQEAAFAFSNTIAYIQEVLARGLDIDSFARRISFFFATGTQIFEEAARYRAARRLWARLMKERFGAKSEDSMLFRFTGTVGGSTYRAREPENNLVRGAYGLLANVLGGVQGMLHPALDEPFAIPSEETARLALRTQQICAYETGVTKTVDPLGGSYYVEALTDQIEEAIVKGMEEIEALGGAVAAVEQGYMQRRIAEEAYRIAREELSGERVVVGVNRFQADEKEKRKLAFHKWDRRMQDLQIQRLEQVRKDRDNGQCERALDGLRKAAQGEGNLLPPLIEAVKTYASIGEIMTALKEVFGVYKEPICI
jgi:methylmalonyl-CoA mutase, N-terminal domain